MDGKLKDDKVIIDDTSISQRLFQRGFGTLVDGALELNLLEALYLLDRGTITVSVKGKELSRSDMVGKCTGEDDFLRRYRVYSDLRKRGYVIKTGFKFGAHFRVYEKGAYTQDGHSTMLVHVYPEDAAFSFSELARAVRLTQSVKKKLMFTVVDDEGDITYYLIDRVIP